MKVSFDTEKKEAIIDGVVYDLQERKSKTMADTIEQWIGAKEWDETVTTIQNWYYGSMRKTAWCCTTVSYTAEVTGVLNQLGGKAEDCDVLKNRMIGLNRLDATKNHGGGAYNAKRGDVVFISSKETLADVTHVGIVSKINLDNGELVVTSGNSSDSIKQDRYNYFTDKRVVAFGRVD